MTFDELIMNYPELIEQLTERAAIMQYDGGMTRYEAEARAAEYFEDAINDKL